MNYRSVDCRREDTRRRQEYLPEKTMAYCKAPLVGVLIDSLMFLMIKSGTLPIARRK